MTKENWATIGEQFTDRWNFPSVLEVIDGKHRIMDCSKFGRSQYFNCKHFYSTVFLAMWDANYFFTYVSIGSFGKNNDVTVFGQLSFFNDGMHNLPPATAVNGHSATLYAIR